MKRRPSDPQARARLVTSPVAAVQSVVDRILGPDATLEALCQAIVGFRRADDGQIEAVLRADVSHAEGVRRLAAWRLRQQQEGGILDALDHIQRKGLVPSIGWREALARRSLRA
jgi:hypothetical protein